MLGDRPRSLARPLVDGSAFVAGGSMQRKPMTIAMLGTRGVPARYGGFETAVEEIGQRLAAAGHRVQVFCRLPDGASAADQPDAHLGMDLVHLPAVKKRTLETLSHTALSVAHPALSQADCAIVFNAANAPFLPVLRARGIPTATHVDGLEWRRSKWSGAGRRYYRTVEALAVRWSDALIADAVGIADYYRDEFAAQTELIAYGAPILESEDSDRVTELGLVPGKYHLVVARFEPENHVLDIVRGYCSTNSSLPLVVVGSAPYADEYTRQIEEAADSRVILLGGVWDQAQLNQLYANSLSYLHGHSVGGTNPSLLRAAGAGAFTIAYDCVFNREVLGENADYFSSARDVAALITACESAPLAASNRGELAREDVRRYDWDDVAASYEALCRRLVAKSFGRRRPSGRRLGLWAEHRTPARELEQAR